MYDMGKMSEECHHIVLRLPPYHCELDPIKLIQAVVKTLIACHNVSYKLNEIRVTCWGFIWNSARPMAKMCWPCSNFCWAGDEEAGQKLLTILFLLL